MKHNETKIEVNFGKSGNRADGWFQIDFLCVCNCDFVTFALFGLHAFDLCIFAGREALFFIARLCVCVFF